MNRGAVKEVQEHERSVYIDHVYDPTDQQDSSNLQSKIAQQTCDCKKIKLESVDLVKTLMKKGDYLMKLDLTDAYYSIPISQEHKQFLRFQIMGKTYEYQCLPFGPASAPRAFKKLTKPVLALLRAAGIRIVLYTDDFLIVHRDFQETMKMFKFIVQLLTNLGFVVKREKFSVAPTQELTFLSALLNDNLCPKGKINRSTETMLRSEEQRDLYSERPCYNTRAGMVGTRQSQSTQWHAPESSPVRADNSHRCLKERLGSVLQWGEDRRSVKETESREHINVLELKAALLALQSFLGKGIKDPLHIELLMDNSTAVAYLNKRESTKSPTLAQLALEIWTLCLSRNIWITAKHLPGVLNVEADLASRNFNNRTEWTLDKTTFKDVTSRFYTPQVDLFASTINRQLPLYVARYPDPEALAVDAFSQKWDKWSVFIHPPIILLPRILQKIRRIKQQDL
ncbi:Gag-Pol polyprotein [Stylophora pistillata]|uniref:Gag-Pol polyprotein n=1 Tax=Stylophora pistillata TaxID=50429 RepID=A0A2B4RNW1_STYPI|nr:Gag-Pol polyprotein [Stylophora pistillata]